MTTAQWLFEYYALIEKEKTNTDQTIEILKTLRKVLIEVLGLDLLSNEDNPESIVPFSMLAGRREIIDSIIEKIESKKRIDDALNDDAFEAMSRAMASGDIGDMDPILEPVDMKELKIKNIQKELSNIGVEIVDTPLPITSHVNAKKDPNKTLKITFDDNG